LGGRFYSRFDLSPHPFPEGKGDLSLYFFFQETVSFEDTVSCDPFVLLLNIGIKKCIVKNKCNTGEGLTK